ncbi:MAG TPA: alanine/glycine:cation symporter family protein [Acetobacteraceae bacterium]|nr:alanine/glycine:cation symporter family protein [Acetobacteraceae bacterium]
MDSLLATANQIIWSWLLVYLLIGAGLWFTWHTGFVQFRRFGTLWSTIFASRGGAKGGISSFQAFAVGLASRVGTGNIAGVAIALTLGGPGAIFWMWCVAVLGMATAFVEATLAQIFKVPQPDGSFRGGPAYYIRTGLGSPGWGAVFAVLLIVTFGLAFNAVQANTIADVLQDAYGLSPLITAVALAALAAPVFLGGVRAVARVAEWLAPLMAAGYVLLALVIVVLHADRVPEVLMLILRSAFGLEPAVAGATGGMLAAMLNGVRRGLFSNEAGMGSAPNAAATATVAHPVQQGFVQSLGVFIDTMVICSATAFIILVSGLYDPTQPARIEGATLTQAVMAAEFGTAGLVFMSVAVFLFAFSSILGNYAYAECNATFLSSRRVVLRVFRVLAIGAVLGGSLAELPLVWTLADITMGLMALVNLVAILLLGRWAFGALADWEAAARHGTPEFRPVENPHLPAALPTRAW